MRKKAENPSPPRKSLVDALFPKVRQDIFAATFMQPDRWWYLSNLARQTSRTPSSLQRELKDLVETGIFKSRVEGNRIYYQPSKNCPIYLELKAITTKTVGLVDCLQGVFQGLESAVDWAFVYGSMARGEERSNSDLDLMVIGSISLRDLTIGLRSLRQHLQRDINPSVFPLEEFKKRVHEKDPFLINLLDSPKLYILGEHGELDRALGTRSGASTRD